MLHLKTDMLGVFEKATLMFYNVWLTKIFFILFQGQLDSFPASVLLLKSTVW